MNTVAVSRADITYATCGYQKPNPDCMALVDLAVDGDQMGGARVYWLQVGPWLWIAGSPDRESDHGPSGSIEVSRCVSSSRARQAQRGGWCSGRAAVLVMESAEMRETDDVARVRRVNGSWLRALLTQREMSSRRVVVGQVRAKNATQMSFIENDMVVETVSPNRSDQPLHVGILPG